MGDPVWLARLRGLALAVAAVTLAASGVKTIGPLTISDLLLVVAVVLLLPRFEIGNAQRLWVPLAAVSLITIGGTIGTLAVSSSELGASGEMLGRFVATSYGAVLLLICWRPGHEQITSFGWLWVVGAVGGAVVALSSGLPRPAGLTPHPTHLAVISVVMVGVTFGLIASDRRRIPLVLGLGSSGLLLAAVVASGSRAALGAAVLVVLLVLIATRSRIAVTIALAVIVASVGLAVLNLVGGTPEWTPGSSQGNAFERLFEERAELGRDREAFRDAGWENFKSHPLTGVGFADATKPHNLLLQMASSAGLLGILGVLMLVALALRGYVLAVRRKLASPATWAMTAGLSAAVLGYVALNMFQNVIWDRTVWVAIALMSWSTAAAIWDDGRPTPEDDPGAQNSPPTLPAGRGGVVGAGPTVAGDESV